MHEIPDSVSRRNKCRPSYIGRESTRTTENRRPRRRASRKTPWTTDDLGNMVSQDARETDEGKPTLHRS